ncbi:MAG: hypothetical protein CVT49_04600 [candidate division Zixibacteria bacterium HGW-Zixibacteria-1]|nr:MAG: hypothetical protein CVT49_04600 [candidate division Zixibacteria bacterium HGW-Zixibacteria-1]
MKDPISSKDGFYIGVTCPGCGGGLEIQSDFFVLNCCHCGSNLRINMPETPPAYFIRSEKPLREVRFHLDRYLKQHAGPLSGAGLTAIAVYYPYWKIDAVVLKVRNETIERVTSDEYDYENIKTYEQKMTDIRLTPYSVTQAAGPSIDYIPPSIGIRSQYSKILPYSVEKLEEGFSSLPLLKSWHMVKNDLDRSIAAIASVAQPQFGKNRTELFHPSGSIIYFPYYILDTNSGREGGRFISDGVTGKVISQIDKEIDHDQLRNLPPGNMEFGRLSVEFHRCLNCGVDLPDRQSHIYICDNCGQLITPGKRQQGLKKICYIGSGEAQDRMFPFWALKLNKSDAQRMRKFFGGIYASDTLAIPAFKIPNFEAMFRLAKRISSAMPKLELMQLERQGKNFADVTLSLENALAMAEVILYREYIKRAEGAGKFDGSLKPDEISLFYAPFRKEHYFFVDTVLGAVTFEKSLAL